MYRILLIFLASVNCQHREPRFKIVLLKELGQTEELKWVQNSLKFAGSEFNLTAVSIGDDEDGLEKVCNALSNGANILVDISWAGYEAVLNISSDIGIPYVHIDVSINVALEFLDTYLDKRNATDVLMIFDNPDYIDPAIFYWIDKARLRMVISDNINRTTAERFKKIRPIPNNFALVASTKNMIRLFEMALRENLVSLPDRWNLVFLDFQYSYFKKDLVSNLPISLLMFYEDLCCDILEKVNCRCPENFNLRENFVKLSVTLITKVMLQLDKESREFPVVRGCNGEKQKSMILNRFYETLEKEIGKRGQNYNKHTHLLQIKTKGYIEKGGNGSTTVIANVQGNVIDTDEENAIESVRTFYRIGITHALPWSYKEQDPDTGEWKWTGYCADFAYKLAEVMDFDFEFVEPKSGTFGEKVNGVWDGVVGDLAAGDTDIAITAIIMTADKEEVIDFVVPYFEQTGITIVMRKPVRKTSLFKFMTVLKLEVWLSIVAALIITGFMIWFLDKYSPYSAVNNKKAYPYPCREFTLKESFWFALTSFTPQGGGEAPKALSARTLVAAYWLFVVLMLATFTANLAAFLTVERMQAPVQSLEQLARQSRINYTVVSESETHKYFINMKFAEDTLYRMWKEQTLNASTDDTRYRVWDYPIREQYGHILIAINDSNPVANASEGFRIVNEHLDADFAFIHDSSEIKYEISKNCNLTEVGEVFAEKPYAVAVQQGSHLQDELSKTILDLQKDRFFEELQAKYWNHSAKGDCPTVDDNEGITLESLGGVFIATLFGLALAMVTLAGEVLYYRRKKKKENRSIQQQIKNLPDKIPAIVSSKLILPKNQPADVGANFRAINLKDKMRNERDSLNISHITLYPRARNRISQVND